MNVAPASFVVRPCPPAARLRAHLLRGCGLALVAVAAWSSAEAAGQAGEPVADQPAGVEEEVEFIRVHVPAGRLSDIPLGTARYVPMSAREFEAGVARLSAAGAREAGAVSPPVLVPHADAARYLISLADDGSLVGTVAFDVGSFAKSTGEGGPSRGGMPREIPLGRLDVRSAAMRTGAGTGEAVVFGRRDGTLAVSIAEAGTCTCEFRCPSRVGAAAAPQFSLPLVPALFSAITLQLPRGIRPLVAGDLRLRKLDDVRTESTAEAAPAPASSTVVWQIDTGPRESLELTLVGAEPSAPGLAIWTDVAIRRSQSMLGARVQPTAPWVGGTVRIEKDAALIVTHVALAAGSPDDPLAEVAWTDAEDGRAILIALPPACVGTREPLLISAVSPIADQAAPLPLLRAPAGVWAGGGIAINVVPSLTLASIELDNCLIVPPEVATRWPLASMSGKSGAPGPFRQGDVPPAAAAEDEATPGVWPARLFVEEQDPNPVARLSLRPRAADFDVARVTTVDLSPGLVVARAACDVRVQRGESFAVVGKLTPGWFIDSVEAIPLPAMTELQATVGRPDADEPTAGLDWKVIRDTRGDVLRIGLVVAVTPARGLGLRITGHRSGIPLGEDFSTASLDMVRLDGESERSAFVDLRTNPETIVEFDAAAPTGTADPLLIDGEAFGQDGRLAALVEEGTARARIRAGFRAPSRNARLVRRRPPLDARTEVRLTVRDDRLTESVTFSCEPSVSDLDSIVVQFSTPVDDRLEWSLLPPAAGVVSARRLDSVDRRGGGGGAGAAGADRWLVELNPPARGAVTIRAARTIPFTRATPVLLAWVDGAKSTLGHCLVRSVGRIRPTVVNRRLTELPPEAAALESESVTVAEFSFDPGAAGDSVDDAAAELLPGGDEPKAWACRESATSWCHASGATEHETLFEVENHGRTSLTLGIPTGHRVQGILLDGLRLPLSDRATVGGIVPIELPAGRSPVKLSVLTVAEADRANGRVGDGAWSAWRVDPPRATLDIPVLQREWRLFMPPELEVALVGGSARLVGTAAESRDWAARLFALPAWGTPRPATAAAVRTGEMVQGFRAIVVSPAGADASVVVVPAGVLSAATVIAALIAACGTLRAARASLRAAVPVCLFAGVAALWLVAPFDAIARAAWWGALAALLGAAMPRTADDRGPWLPWLRKGVAVLLFGFSLAAEPGWAADDGGGSGGNPASLAPAAVSANRPPAKRPLQVFITPIDAGHETDRRGESTVLVPEELFRAIIRGEDGRSGAAVRVLEVRVTTTAPAGDGPWPAWRLAIDVDADTRGMLLLDQAGGGRYLPDTLRMDGNSAAASLDAGGGPLRIMVPAAGRHTVSVDVEPASRRRGEVETATIALPFAPSGSLRLSSGSGGTAVGDVICEQASGAGAFTAATRRPAGSGDAVFDVSRATHVRLARPAAVGRELAVLPPTALSRNDIFWNLDECRLTGAYEIDGQDAIVRSCVVAADPGLEWIPPQPRQDGRSAADQSDADGVSIQPLGDHRYLVERHRPDRGRFRFEMPFRLAFADPVGVFDVPEAWLEDVAVDTRTVRFVASPSLAVRIDLPTGLMPMAVPEGEASFDARFWQGKVSRPGMLEPGGAAAFSAGRMTAPVSPLRARLKSERRRQEIRGTQRETITFAAEQVLIQLDARLDATSTALVTIPLEVPERSVIDRIELVEDEVLQPETAERGAIDVRWSRLTETSLDVVVQRPRAGRFRLEVEARIPGRPADRGTLPCLRVGLADGSRTLIDWRTDAGLRVTLDRRAGQQAAAGEIPVDSMPFELVTGDALPTYLLEAVPLEPAPATAAADAPAAMPDAGVATGEGRVELADIRLVTDERGRMWGVARFELVPADRVVRLQLPRAWRLFDAAVDGRPVGGVVPAVTSGDNVWDIPLLDSGRPRSLVVLFAGELFGGERGRRLLSGEPLALTPPTVVGLECHQVLWTLQVPEGIVLRVAAPARIATAAEVPEMRQAAWQRLEVDFQRALGARGGWQQDRFRGFLESRRDGAMPSADQVASRTLAAAVASVPLSPPLVVVAAEGAAGPDAGCLTIRAVRRRDPTTRGKAIATLSLLACGGLAWMLARRRG